jgi:hypothetical protein
MDTRHRKDYWRPQYKWQLVEWFFRQGILSKSKASRMNKNNLYGKYIEIRRGVCW